MLDGFKVTDELFNNPVINPSVDSIQEFKIQKSMYPPEFGGKASALINVATKAGSNRVHGSLFEFIRDDRFDAHNFFDDRRAPVPPLEQHQFGGSLGGRLVKDRTFFFVSYERQRTRRSITKTFSVPDAALRAGDFSGFGPICDPGTIDPATGACTPFANDQIPADRLDPIAQAFLAHVPLPNGEGRVQNLTAVEPQDKAAHQFSVRVDHRLSDTDQLFVRFSSFDADEVQPFGTGVQQEALVPGFGRTLDTTTRNLGISHTRTFGSSMLNELRFGYMSVKGGQASLNAGVDFAGQVGLQGVSRNPRDVGFPQISTAGLYSTMGDPTTFVSRDNEHFEVYDNFLIDRGDHRLKFGGYLFHLKFRPLNADTARGAFTYTGQWTGNALADLLLGFPTSARSGIGGSDEDARTTWLHLYAQDGWRARDNLPAGQRSAGQWFNTAAFALQAPCHLRQRRPQQRVRPGPGERRSLNREGLVLRRAGLSGVPLGDLQPAQPCQPRRAEPDLRHPEFRSHLQRPERPRDAVRSALQFLTEGEPERVLRQPASGPSSPVRRWRRDRWWCAGRSARRKPRSS